MKLGKLAKQLRKELTASPGKAAILGIGCLVAGYFWAPLIMPKRKPSVVETAVEQSSTHAVAATPVSVAQNPISAAYQSAARWNEVIAARLADPLMKTVRLDPNLRNPFESRRPVRPEVSQAEVPVAYEAVIAEPEKPVAPRIVWEIAQFQIDLRTVSFGRRSRFAQINGTAVEEGDELLLQAEGLTEPVRFLVSEIHADAVVISAEGKDYTIRLPERGLPKNAVRIPSGARLTSHSSAG